MAADDRAAQPSTIEHRRWWPLAAAATLLAVYFLLAVTGVAHKCATFDEVFHLTGGYSYWTISDFRMQPENGNLPQRWAALPLLFGDYKFPAVDSGDWRRSSVAAVGGRFVYGAGNDADRMLLSARAMIALVGVALGTLVFAWTWRLLGLAAALVSLTLFAFCPTLLANGSLATSDMAAALFFLATVGAFWRVLHRTTWGTLLVSSLALGGLCVAKFSAPLVAPMLLVLVGVQLFSDHEMIVVWGTRTWRLASLPARLAAQAAILVVHAAVAWGVIWTFYDFHYAMFRPSADIVAADRTANRWDQLLDPRHGTIDRLVLTARDYHLLPEAYLYGLAHVYRFSQDRQAFWNGHYSRLGWPAFFPYCALVKTPLSLFVLMGLGLAAIVASWRSGDGAARPEVVRRTRDWLYRAAPLWTLFIVYWASAIASHLNIGHRHILPVYPVMIMLAGAAAWWIVPPAGKTYMSVEGAPSDSPAPPTAPVTRRRNPLLAGIVLVCIALFAGESLRQWPNYLAYFNVLAGGSVNGYRHLADSSLDWGQDLPSLADWLANEHGDDAQPVYLSYFGMADPRYYGIQARRLPSFAEPPITEPPRPLVAGVYCISATLLDNLYSYFPGRWSREYEATYQQLAVRMRALDATADDPDARAGIVAQIGGEQGVIDTYRYFEHARFARLTSYLRQRRPDVEINYSILIYRLSQIDLTRGLVGPFDDVVGTPE